MNSPTKKKALRRLKATLNPNAVLEQNLYNDTDILAMRKGRRVGQPGHELARGYLLERLEELGLSPFLGDSYELPYEGKIADSKKKHTFTNIVGVIPGSDKSLAPILIGAHYDSVIDAPCADDNATSVALNLAIAEMVVESPLERDLIVAFFDAEEPPYFLTEHMGSTRFYEDHCSDRTFAGVIITDLIGHDFDITDLVDVPKPLSQLIASTKNIVFMTGAESDSIHPEVIEEVATAHPGISVFPTLNDYVGNMSDHHAFEQAGHPFLFFSCAQGRYYHDERDTLEWINFKKLAKLTHFIRDVIYQLDQTPTDRTRAKEDPVDFEIAMIKKAIGPTKLKLILKAAGAPMPNTRDDLDHLIGRLTQSVY